MKQKSCGGHKGDEVQQACGLIVNAQHSEKTASCSTYMGLGTHEANLAGILESNQQKSSNSMSSTLCHEQVSEQLRQ